MLEPEQFQFLFQKHHAPMLLLHADSGRIMDANEAALDFYGYSRQALLALRIQDINQLSEQEIQEELQAATSQQRNHFFFRHRLADGSIRDVEVHSTPIHDGPQKILFSIIHDISQRKEAEAKLQTNEKFLENILESIQDGVLVLNTDMTVRRSNAAIRRWHGDSPLIGRPCYQIFYDRSSPCEDCPFRRTISSKQMERTIKKFNIFQDERQERWFELSTYPLREGASQEITGIVEFFRDITENKQKENRLRQYELTLESASDPIFLVDHQYRFVLVNEACVRFVGLTKDKILGRHITEILDKEVFAHHLRAPLEAALSGSKQTLETWLETPRLGRRYTSLSFTPFINEEKNNTGAVVNLRDLTQQQRMQQELIQAKDEANHANEAKSQFLAAMSHEIRTPMNAIVGMTDLALMTPDEADQHEYLTILKGSAQHLMGIINDILDIAKIESGKMELASEPFSLNKMLSSLYQVFRHEMAAKKLDFHLNISEKLPEYVLGDEIRLRQVLTNLLSNARKFTEHGYVSLKAELFRPAPEISVTFSSTPANSPLAWIRFEVQDSGIGIPPDRQEAIFDRFQQADTTTARRFGGTGLGLAISQQLLAQMGGELDLTSSPEQGSTFAATVPLPIVHSTMGHDLPSPKQPQELEKALPTDSPFPQSLHILLAEDNRINSKLAQKVLEKLGHGVQIVEDGRQALDELRRSSYDLVLMDVEMPRMDGLEACRRVRQGESGLEQRELPIIAMTAHALTDIQRKAEAAGMDGYITKPIDITTLDKTIREILNKQPLRPKDS